MNICYKCQAQTRAGTRNAVGAWLCNKCALTNHTLHYDYYDAETDSMKTPFHEMDEKEQYQHFIDFCYQLFGGLSTDTYKRAREFNQQYSYLEMTRAIEYFYIVKKNDKTKAKKRIGIIPYIISHSNEYYKIVSAKHLKRDRTQAQVKAEQKVIELNVQNTDKPKKQLSMEGL